MMPPSHVEFQYYRVTNRQRRKRFGALAKVFATAAFPFLGSNIDQASKRDTFENLELLHQL